MRIKPPESHDSVEARFIASQIELDKSHVALQFGFDPELGFAYTNNATDRDATPHDIIGFVGNINQVYEQGTFYQRVVSAKTDWSELTKPEKKLEKGRFKGIGPRVRNTPQALQGTAEDGNVEVFAFALNPENIVNMRQENDITGAGKLSRIARHAGRATAARIVTAKFVSDRVHKSFGDPDKTDAVVYSQPPKTEILQGIKRIENPGTIPPELMIIRNPFIVLRRIGVLKPE